MTPAPPLLVLLVAWAVLGLAASAGVVPAWSWQAAGAASCAGALVDAWRLHRIATPEVAREIPEALPLGVRREVTLALAGGRHALRIDVHDLHPSGWACEGLPRSLVLPAGGTASFAYTLRPDGRGDFTFDGVQLRLLSPWRLWRQSRIAGAPRQVRVYPDFAPLAKFALLGADQASRAVGAHLKRRRGEGTDFHQMRDYRVGDSLRQIDWKATARMHRLVSREYQDERNQHLLVVLDTGRRMLAREPAAAEAGAGLAHFDHVLNAALVVSYLALRQGDAVGLLASGGPSRWVAPQRGMAAIDVLLRQTYDLQPQPVATDYLAAASELSLRQPRRALVMLVTNLRDEDIDEVLAAVKMLQRRHQVIVASLRERALDAVLDTGVRDLGDALRAAATARYLQQRTVAHEALRSHGVIVLDVDAASLAGALVERYLAIKRGGLL